MNGARVSFCSVRMSASDVEFIKIIWIWWMFAHNCCGCEYVMCTACLDIRLNSCPTLHQRILILMMMIMRMRKKVTVITRIIAMNVYVDFDSNKNENDDDDNSPAISNDYNIIDDYHRSVSNSIKNLHVWYQ